MTCADRRVALVAALPDDIDAILVTKLVNVRYLTGFTGSNGAVAIARGGDAVLATDGRYREQAAVQSPDVRLIVTRTLAPDLVAASAGAGVRRLAIERHHVTLSAHDALVAAADGVDLTDCGELVESLRTRKDDAEIAALRAACDITDLAFAAVLRQLREGVTERDVAWWLLSAMRAEGAEAAAFDSIVAFGPHSAIPHHQPTDRVLQRGDLVKLDFGARVAGYHADMTRTLVCGSAQNWQRDLHAEVARVQQRCRDAAVVGALPVEVDGLAQRLVADGGHMLVHGLGHGVGLEIHERPFLVPNGDTSPLQTGMGLTVEPGIYLPGKGGVRVEDTVVIGPAGAELLTRSSRELLVV